MANVWFLEGSQVFHHVQTGCCWPLAYFTARIIAYTATKKRSLMCPKHLTGFNSEPAEFNPKYHIMTLKRFTLIFRSEQQKDFEF
jgi:hypothetical protein